MEPKSKKLSKSSQGRTFILPAQVSFSDFVGVASQDVSYSTAELLTAELLGDEFTVCSKHWPSLFPFFKWESCGDAIKREVKSVQSDVTSFFGGNFAWDDDSCATAVQYFPNLQEITVQCSRRYQRMVSVDALIKMMNSLCHLKHIALFNVKLDLSFPKRIPEHIESVQLVSSGLRNDERETLVPSYYHYVFQHEPEDSNDEEGNSFQELLLESGFQQCGRCGHYFREGCSIPCICHTGKYTGYGASCSSYECCGGFEPPYDSTYGCVSFDTHKVGRKIYAFTIAHRCPVAETRGVLDPKIMETMLPTLSNEKLFQWKGDDLPTYYRFNQETIRKCGKLTDLPWLKHPYLSCRKACLTVLCIRWKRKSILSQLPKEIVTMIVKMLWKARFEDYDVWERCVYLELGKE